MALKSHGLVTSCEKLKKYPIPQSLLPTDFTGCLYTIRSPNAWCYMSLELRVLVSSSDKIKIKYIFLFAED